MDITKEYIVINEFGKYAQFDELGVFIKWSSTRKSTPHKWAAEIILVSNPGCKIELAEAGTK